MARQREPKSAGGPLMDNMLQQATSSGLSRHAAARGALMDRVSASSAALAFQVAIQFAGMSTKR